MVASMPYISSREAAKTLQMKARKARHPGKSFRAQRSQQRNIYLAGSVNGFDPHPAIGEFKDGRGEFYSHEPFEGKYILCRVIWSEITPTSCHWEQAFSADGDRTWETNWITNFGRMA